LLKMRDTVGMENLIYTPDVYAGSIPMGQPGARGLHGTATLTGDTIPNLRPLNYSESTYQNIPGYELSGQTPYQPMGRNGGMYQEGGTYELSDDEIDDIINRGGEIQYY